MVTCNKYGDRANRMWMELYGLSTDEKPIKKMGTIGIGNASTFYEMDTKKHISMMKRIINGGKYRR